jgi:hypothetical protein
MDFMDINQPLQPRADFAQCARLFAGGLAERSGVSRSIFP